MPEISVIITTYKGSKYINRAIESVLGQTYNDFELIIVDDNFPMSEERKKTEKIVTHYDSEKIIYIKHDRNKNGAAARNTGIRVARGRYIAFLDDDDFYFPERLELCKKTLEKSNKGAIYTSVAFVNDEKITGVCRAVKSGNLFNDLLLDENLIGTGSNIFIKNSYVSKLKGFDERYRRNQDYEFMLRYFEIGEMEALDDILVVKATNGVINIPPFDVMFETKKMILERFKIQIKRLDNEQREKFQNNIFQSLLNCSFIHLNMEHIKKTEKLGNEWGIKMSMKDKARKILAMLHIYKKSMKLKKVILRSKKGDQINDKRKSSYIYDFLRKYENE